MPGASTAPPKSPAGMEPGDHVYAKHPKHGALTVKVLAVGKDGFTAEDGTGARHKVTHDSYLGHKTRSLHTLKIVDEGADGSLLEGPDGRRRFLAGQLPKPPEPPPPPDPGPDDPLLQGLGRLAKALAPLPPLPECALGLLLKARGGVRKTPTQPSQRKKATPAKPAVKEPEQHGEEAEETCGPPKHKHGDRVQFRHGDVVGEGVIVGSGGDGVFICDDQGREHPVRHDALLPKHPPKRPLDKAPKA